MHNSVKGSIITESDIDGTTPSKNRLGHNPRLILFCLIILGIIGIVHFTLSWFKPGIANNSFLYILLTISFYFYIFRYLGYWLIFLNIRDLPFIPAPEGLKVDAMTTAAPGEPVEMIQKSLLALQTMTYPHETYLLDDSNNPELEIFCKTQNIHYITRTNKKNAKCGNVNNGLQHSNGDFVFIIDPDHLVEPDYLDNVLGYFNDPKVGFVQTTQAYYNQYLSFVAKAGAEQTYLFYGPVLKGLMSLNANLVIGTNCTFRRATLDSINLYKPGLAEDLHTSMAIHSKGWESVYVGKIMAKGLTPADLTSFLHQQLKWSRGVLELMFHNYLHYAKGLNWKQRLCYLLNMSFYFESIMILLNLSLPMFYFATGELPVKLTLQEFIIYIGPWLTVSVLIFLYVQKWLCDPKEKGLMWRGLFMQYLSFPAHILGIICAIIGKNIPYFATTKTPLKKYPFILLSPQIILVLITVGYVVFNLFSPLQNRVTGMLMFAIFNAVNIDLAILISFFSHEKMVQNPLYMWWQSTLRHLYHPHADNEDLEKIPISSTFK